MKGQFLKPTLKTKPPMRIQFVNWLMPLGAGALLFGSSVNAAVFWDESINGDLSNDKAIPNQFTLASGVNTLNGTVGAVSGSQDWFTLTVPANFQFQTIIPRVHGSLDTAFIGFQNGNSFVGNENTDATAYRGYTHVSPGTLNTDIMPAMGTAPGAQGFTPPLGPGSYTFLIQQLGGETAYQFEFTAIPEARGQVLIAALCAAYFLKKRWPRKFSKAA